MERRLAACPWLAGMGVASKQEIGVVALRVNPMKKKKAHSDGL